MADCDDRAHTTSHLRLESTCEAEDRTGNLLSIPAPRSKGRISKWFHNAGGAVRSVDHIWHILHLHRALESLQVSLELDFDGAWYTWAGNPRPLTVLSDVPELQRDAERHQDSLPHFW